jgi:hypothetical protein
MIIYESDSSTSEEVCKTSWTTILGHLALRSTRYSVFKRQTGFNIARRCTEQKYTAIVYYTSIIISGTR